MRIHLLHVLSIVGASLAVSSGARAQMQIPPPDPPPAAPPPPARPPATKPAPVEVTMDPIPSPPTPTPNGTASATATATPNGTATATPNGTATATPIATPTLTLTPIAAPHERDISNANDDVPLRTPVGAPVFAEELPPPGDPDSPNAIRFQLHGYFRAPFLMAWKLRSNPTPNEGKFELHTPFLIDNDYVNSGFAYTPVNETGYGEFFLMAGNKSLTATVALMASEYSDSSQVTISDQLGISQGYLTYRYEPDLIRGVKTHVQVKGGAFWDRFGYMEHYDTYIFGRTHQIGYQLRVDADIGDLNLSLLQGMGAHLENLQANQAFSLLNYVRAAATYKDQVQVGLYYLRSWSQDQPPLSTLQDADMLVWGFDARVNSPTLGRLYAATSFVSARESLFLSPSIELMNSQGGTGLTNNYFGTTSSNNGTGGMWNVGWQYDYSLASLFRTLHPHSVPLWGGDMRMSLYGLYSVVSSDQKTSDPNTNRNGVTYFKYGAEFHYWALSWLGASVRYDRVVMNIQDEASSFRIFAPRLNVRTHFMGEALIFLQYSHYFYGDGVTLRPGQASGETVDENVVKLQAQMEF